MMEQLNAGDLDIMISPENQDLLDDLFDKKEKEVKIICDELQKAAQDQSESGGGESSLAIKDNQIVINHM